MGDVASSTLNQFVEAVCVVEILLLLLKYSRIIGPIVLSFHQTFMVVAMHHQHTLNLRKLGHIVTFCCSNTFATTWGGKVGPTAVAV